MKLSIPQALPYLLGRGIKQIPIFQMETLRLPVVAKVAKFQHQSFSFFLFFLGTRTPSLESKALGRVAQKTKG